MGGEFDLDDRYIIKIEPDGSIWVPNHLLQSFAKYSGYDQTYYVTPSALALSTDPSEWPPELAVYIEVTSEQYRPKETLLKRVDQETAEIVLTNMLADIKEEERKYNLW